MRRLFTPIAIVFALLLSTSQVCAWSAAGHTVVGAIAYDVMKKEHPAELAKVLSILHEHPTYDTLSKKVDTSAENFDRALFMAAARWPDDVRYAKGGYSHPDWHYVDFPIIAKGENVTGKPPAAVNALTSLAKQTDVLSAKWSVPKDKAIAICWIAHLVGDLHQPLHCCSLYTAALPDGDRGGNETFVRVGTKRTIPLHKFWDELLGSSAKYQDNANTAAQLRLRPEFARDKLPELRTHTTPNDWAIESFEAASTTAYIKGTLQGGGEKSGVALPATYPNEAKAAAERRAILAGYRLADALTTAVK
ncbi:MAG: hypothetical protein JWM57_1569 [Phycisphaerales bacterium]|nr:hypothetical protein [Phycisphaerales bacterium]